LTQKGGRSAVESYASAWQGVFDALWREELEDPLFRAAAASEESDAGWWSPPNDWVHREAWRDHVRCWWSVAKGHYSTVDAIPKDWVMCEVEREHADCYDVEVFFEAPVSNQVDTVEFQETKWRRIEALIDTEAFWPLHLDSKRLLRAQYEQLAGLGLPLDREDATQRDFLSSLEFPRSLPVGCAPARRLDLLPV